MKAPSAVAEKWLILSLCIAILQPAWLTTENTPILPTTSGPTVAMATTDSMESDATPVPPTNSSNSTAEAVFETPIDVFGNNICEGYHAGGICTPVLTPFPVILTNLSRSSNQSSAASTVDVILYTLSQFNAPQYCTEAVVPLLCRYTFPTCDPAYRMPTYQPICRRDCEIVRDFLCREPWAAMIRLLALLDFQYLDQPDCEPLRNTEAGDSPMCINTLSKGVIPRPLYTGSCYSGNGRGYQGSINVTESGYTCQSWAVDSPHQHLLGYENYEELSGGHNFCRNPGERGKRPWCFTTDRNKRWEYCDVPECAAGPTCVSHQFSVCRLEGTIGMDWVYVDTSVVTPGQRANGTQSALEHISQYSQPCADILREYLCILNFPSCDLSSNEPRPIMPCRSFCERVQSVCGNDITELKSFNSLFKSVFFSTDCGAMPMPSGGDAPECYEQTNIFSSASTSSLVETDCFNSSDLGVSYRGNMSVTSSGKVCQSWLSQEPHPHAVTPVNRSELVGHNHCRNPDSRGSRTWCYTTDPNTRWEYCDVLVCGGNAEESGNSKMTIIIAVIAPVCAFLLIVLLFLLVCVCCCCARRRSKLAKMELKISTGGTVSSAACPVYTKSPRNGLELSDNPLYAANSLVQDPANFEGLKLPEFPRENIFYIKDLGQGHFGVVVQAEAVGIDPAKEKSTVAIKVMKEGASTQTRKEFFREASLMHTFDHPNIVKLLGVCINQEPLCMIFEFMELGDLNQYLRQSAPKQVGGGGGGGGMPSLSTQQLVYMTIDIAAGLEYLAQNHFVHRDLATRNCLVSRDLHIKISDFGLSQDVYTTDYFKMGDTELLPIRWMPPEAILYAKFTVQSDIWSFGVVMWEIYSFGIQPYFSMTNEEVVQHVRNGKVLSCPEGCPQDIYDLIVDCWVMDPSERPTAAEIHDGLLRWSPEQAGLVEQNGDALHPSYQNVATVQGYINPAAIDGALDGDKYDRLEMSGLDSIEENGDATKVSTCV